MTDQQIEKFGKKKFFPTVVFSLFHYKEEFVELVNNIKKWNVK